MFRKFDQIFKKRSEEDFLYRVLLILYFAFCTGNLGILDNFGHLKGIFT